MRDTFPLCSSFRGEMITELGVNVGRKIYPIAGPHYTGDAGVRSTLRFETLSALKKEGRRKNERERERERRGRG